MKTLFLILSMFSSLAVANVGSNLTIVAVGDAEQEKEKFIVAAPVIETSLKGKEPMKIKEFGELLIHDFSFYRHLYDVNQDMQSLGFTPKYRDWKSKGYDYVIQSRIYKKGVNLHLELNTHSVAKGEVVHSVDKQFWVKNVRKFGHSIADSIYKRLTGNDSIFTKKIVFLSDRTSRKKDTRKEMYIMDFDGKRVQRLTYNNSMIISPSVSPDNKKVLFSMIQSRWRRSSSGKIHKVKNLNLYLYDMATRKASPVSDREGINSGAIFTQDPNQIYLTLSLAKNADIYRMDLKSKQISRVTRHRSDDVDPHINSSGNLMTFLSGRPGKAMIYTMDPHGVEKDVKRISYVGRFNASPRFSPDGKEIVFSSWVDNRFDIYKIDSNGKNLVRLTKNFGSNEEPMFSPDGQFIVFTSQRVISRKKAVQDIYIMNREGEIISKLTGNFGQCFTPRWTN
jgi:TolB protein